ncbi:hypothetical protein GCM10027259_35020 [Micromonospora palomenae]
MLLPDKSTSVNEKTPRTCLCQDMKKVAGEAPGRGEAAAREDPARPPRAAGQRSPRTRRTVSRYHCALRFGVRRWVS